jgi:4,4'-diaponeurosporenoate glycosyltransferase
MERVSEILAYICCVIVWIRLLPYLRLKAFRFLGKPKLAPSVSIIIPVRNEAKTISKLLDSLLQINYPSLEIIVVDDASDDHTKQIAEQYPVKVVSAPDKPASWIGKSWACYHGAQIATGQLILFTDADTTHHPESLRHAVHFFMKNKCSLMSAPAFHKNKLWWEKLLGPFFCIIHAGASPHDEVNEDNAYALGQYLLFDREFYLRIGGHRAIRGSVAEDASIARLTMQAGGTYKMYKGPRLCEVQMYESFTEFCEGWIRIMRLGMKELSISVFLMTLVPLLAFNIPNLYQGDFNSWIPALITLTCFCFVENKIGKFSILGLLLFPMSIVLFLALAVAASLSHLFQMPLRWRGRVMPSN